MEIFVTRLKKHSAITRFRVLFVIAFFRKHRSRYISMSHNKWTSISLSLTCFSENAQELSKRFLDRPTSAMNTSIFWVEYIAKYGNVLQSPALNLNRWQRNLLDVYAFILAVIVTALGVALFVLCKLKNLLFGSRVCAQKDSATIKSKKNKWRTSEETLYRCY